MGETKRDGNWFDEFGACKICDGEIPHGHTPNCDIFKLEQQVGTYKAMAESGFAGVAPPTLCCGYQPNPKLPHPVMWNPFNKVVQCHNCGQVWEPRK
jgi:hypothetical protein